MRQSDVLSVEEQKVLKGKYRALRLSGDKLQQRFSDVESALRGFDVDLVA